MTDKAKIRSAIERHQPGMLAWLDAAKARFPDAKLTQLEIPAAGIRLGADPSIMPPEPSRIEKLNRKQPQRCPESVPVRRSQESHTKVAGRLRSPARER